MLKYNGSVMISLVASQLPFILVVLVWQASLMQRKADVSGLQHKNLGHSSTIDSAMRDRVTVCCLEAVLLRGKAASVVEQGQALSKLGQTWRSSNRLGCGVRTSEVMVLLWASKRCTARCKGVGLTLRRSRFDAPSHGVPADVLKGKQVEHEAFVALSLPAVLQQALDFGKYLLFVRCAPAVKSPSQICIVDCCT